MKKNFNDQAKTLYSLIFLMGLVFAISVLSYCKAEKRFEDTETVGTEISKTTSLPGKKETLDRFSQWTGTKAPSPEELNRLIDKLEFLTQLLEDSAKEIPSDTFDHQAIVDKVGKSPEALFRWVKDNTYLLSYIGSLRGSIGILMDRVGNSLDRSLLLLKLLETAGYRVRLAHALLTENMAEELQKRMIPIPKNFAPQKNNTLKDIFPQIESSAELLNIDSSKLRTDLDSVSRESQQARKNAYQQAAEQSQMLVRLIGDFLVTNKTKRKHDGDALQDHWWVQLDSEEGWLDLDVSSPDGKGGSVITKADETYSLDEINEDFTHIVKIKIIAEQWTEKGIEEHTVLEHLLNPSELFGIPIVLHHHPMNWPEDIDFSGGTDSLQNFKTTVLEQREWMPILSIGNEQISEFCFNEKGDIIEDPSKETRGGVRDVSRGLLSALAGEEKQAEKEAILAAEWIEYEIHIPGRPPSFTRREVFDLIGPAARTSGQTIKPQISDAQKLQTGFNLLANIEILPSICQLSSQYIGWMMMQRLHENLLIMINDLKEGRLVTFDEILYFVQGAIESIQGPLYSWALLRHDCSQLNRDMFLDSVNIVNLRTRFIEDKEDRLISQRIFDIVSNDVAIRVREKDDAASRLYQGVVDTVVENLAISKFSPYENTSELMALSKDFDIKWTSIRNPRELKLTEKDWPKDVLARIEMDLDAGYIVVIPEKQLMIENKPRLGWWRVNPNTGETVGVMDTGFHQTTSDYAYRNWLVAAKNLKGLAKLQYFPMRSPQAYFSMSYPEFLQFLGIQVSYNSAVRHAATVCYGWIQILKSFY